MGDGTCDLNAGILSLGADGYIVTAARAVGVDVIVFVVDYGGGPAVDSSPIGYCITHHFLVGDEGGVCL